MNIPLRGRPDSSTNTCAPSDSGRRPRASNNMQCPQHSSLGARSPCKTVLIRGLSPKQPSQTIAFRSLPVTTDCLSRVGKFGSSSAGLGRLIRSPGHQGHPKFGSLFLACSLSFFRLPLRWGQNPRARPKSLASAAVNGAPTP